MQVSLVKRQGNSPNTIFSLYCPGLSAQPHTLLLLSNGSVNRPYSDVCRDGVVKVAYNNYPSVFEVDKQTNEMIKEGVFERKYWKFIRTVTKYKTIYYSVNLARAQKTQI